MAYEKTYYYQPPTCASCKHFRDFFTREGQVTGLTVCTIEAPKMFAFPVQGTVKDPKTGDARTTTEWIQYSGWPPTFAHSGCGKHEPKPRADAN